MKSVLIFLYFMLQTSWVHGQNADEEIAATLINVNDISMWIRADGITANNPYTQEQGAIFPRGTAGVIFSDGMVWGGQVRDGRPPLVRVGGTTYTTGLQPGKIIEKGLAEDPVSADVRIWRIRKDWQTADLRQDAAEFLNVPLDSVTDAQVNLVRAQYEKDWREWPWQKGAPFYDSNQNDVMDDGEAPGLAKAKQVVWFVANDLDYSAASDLYGSPPIGLELQITLWAYDHHGSQLNEALQNTIFKRYRFIYKGTKSTPDTAHIDSMYIAQWSDPDVGYLADDLAGCDTLLSIGYGYNASVNDVEFQKFDLRPPAIGYMLLQGPVEFTGNPQDVARFNFRAVRRAQNRTMTTFAIFGFEGLPDGGGYYGTLQWWNLLRGYRPRPESPPAPWSDPNTNKPTKFLFPGDPVTRQGWLDRYPGDRRMHFATGPFSMALGDTQEVIIALVGGMGPDNQSSVSFMKYNAGWAQLLARSNFTIDLQDEPEVPEQPLPEFFELHQNFPNPFNPRTEIRYELPSEFLVKLTIFNILGQEVKSLVDETQGAGAYSLTWDGKNEQGINVPSGLYFYKIELGRFSETRKMLLVR